MRALILVALLLTSCSSKCCPGWSGRKTVTHCKQYNSGKIVFPICNTFREMEIEIARTASGTRVYGNAYSLPISKDKSVKASIEVSGISSPITVDLFEGGQRVLFSESAANRIISALENGNEVHLIVGRYKSHITPENFSSASRSLKVH